MEVWLKGYDILDIREYIKQIQHLVGGKILFLYTDTFSGANQLYRERKINIKLWPAFGGEGNLFRTELKGPCNHKFFEYFYCKFCFTLNDLIHMYCILA